MILAADAFYAIEAGPKSYLTRLPKAGGVFKRLVETSALYGNRFVSDGSSYVGDFGSSRETDGFVTGAIVEGKVANPSSTRTLARAPLRSDDNRQLPWRAWDATPTTVYLGYENELYRVARQF